MRTLQCTVHKRVGHTAAR